MGYSLHILLPRGTLKVKSENRLRPRERSGKVHTVRLFSTYFVWQQNAPQSGMASRKSPLRRVLVDLNGSGAQTGWSPFMQRPGAPEGPYRRRGAGNRRLGFRRVCQRLGRRPITRAGGARRFRPGEPRCDWRGPGPARGRSTPRARRFTSIMCSYGIETGHEANRIAFDFGLDRFLRPLAPCETGPVCRGARRDERSPGQIPHSVIG